MSTTDFGFVEADVRSQRVAARERQIDLLRRSNSSEGLGDEDRQRISATAQANGWSSHEIARQASLVHQLDEASAHLVSSAMSELEQNRNAAELDLLNFEAKERQRLVTINAEREQLRDALNRASSKVNEADRLQTRLHWIESEFDRLFGTSSVAVKLGGDFLDKLFYRAEQLALAESHPYDGRDFAAKHVDQMARLYGEALAATGESTDHIRQLVSDALPRLRERVAHGRASAGAIGFANHLREAQPLEAQ